MLAKRYSYLLVIKYFDTLRLHICSENEKGRGIQNATGGGDVNDGLTTTCTVSVCTP